MAANIVQWKKGTSTLATVTAAFDTTPTDGNVVLLIFAADDYNGSPNAGWNQRTGMEQQTYHGGYVWDRVASGGGNSFQYTIGSATNSSWILLEISGLDASYYGTSNGQSAVSSASSYTTPAITPASGADWLLIAAIGSSNNGGDMSADLTTWLNSFTHIASSGPVSATGTRDSIGVAYRVVTGNGSTSYSSGASFPFTKQSHSGMIIALKVASGGNNYSLTASGGAYAVSGTAATLKTSRKLLMASAAYAVTGTAATPRRGFKIAANAASYALTGQAATFKRTYKAAANGGSYATTGTAATLKTARKVVGGGGAYAVTGQPATLKKGRTVAAASGTYALSGQPVTLTKQLLMSANGGAYALVGSDATLTFRTPNIRMTIESGTYEVSGDPVTLSIKRLGGGGGGKVKRTKPKPYRKIPSVRDVVEDIYRQPEPIEQDAAPQQPEIPALDDATRMRSAMTAQEIEALARETQANAQRARSQLLHQSLAAGLPSAQPEWTDEEIAIALLLIA